jgi:hypothetical protein
LVKGWDANEAAKLFDQKAAEYLDNLIIPSPTDFLRQLKSYLQRMMDKDWITEGVQHVKQKRAENGDILISAGPQIHKVDEPSIRFFSGAQLSFGITLRDEIARSRLISYCFHLQLPLGSKLEFFRIDLNPPKDKYDPLDQPRSHMHPGFRGIHVPFPTMSPLEVLDRIFYVIEPHFTK